MVGELDVVAMVTHERGPLPHRPLRGDLVELSVGVALELRPAALVEEELAPLADERPYGGAVEDARRGGEQRIDDVRIVFHRQLEELHDRIDRQIVTAAGASEGVRIDDMMGLELLEAPVRRAETGDLAAEVREEVVLGRDGKAVDVHVA